MLWVIYNVLNIEEMEKNQGKGSQHVPKLYMNENNISRDIFNDFLNKDFKTTCSHYLPAGSLEPPKKFPVPKVIHLDKSYHSLRGLKKAPACWKKKSAAFSWLWQEVL